MCASQLGQITSCPSYTLFFLLFLLLISVTSSPSSRVLYISRYTYFLPLVLLFLCALLLTVVGLLCIGLLFLSVFLLLHVYCFITCVLLSYILQLPDCWLEVRILKFLQPATSVSLCLKANAEMVPKTPCCYCMLLMQPSRLKFLRSLFHTLHYNHCHRATAHLLLNILLLLLLLLLLPSSSSSSSSSPYTLFS